MAAKPPASKLSINASSTHVVYGGALTIFGSLSGTGNANAAVSVQQAPFPYTHYANLASGISTFSELPSQICRSPTAASHW